MNGAPLHLPAWMPAFQLQRLRLPKQGSAERPGSGLLLLFARSQEQQQQVQERGFALLPRSQLPHTAAPDVPAVGAAQPLPGLLPRAADRPAAVPAELALPRQPPHPLGDRMFLHKAAAVKLAPCPPAAGPDGPVATGWLLCRQPQRHPWPQRPPLPLPRRRQERQQVPVAVSAVQQEASCGQCCQRQLLAGFPCRLL